MIWNNSATDFLLFAKFPAQICDTCGAICQPNYEFGGLLWRHLTPQRKAAMWVHNYIPSCAQRPRRYLGKFTSCMKYKGQKLKFTMTCKVNYKYITQSKTAKNRKVILLCNTSPECQCSGV